MAPHSEWPQTIMFGTPRPTTANSIVAVTPPIEAIVLRHEVAGVAEDKQLAGLGIREQKRVDARVAARDDDRFGRLAGRELREQLSIVRENLALKRPYAGNDVLHG